MNVLAVNSSPRAGGRSKTELMLEQLVAGMREAGASVECVALREKTVRPCVACLTCWTRTPGVCAHKDDMAGELLGKWAAADLVVYATPLYHYMMNGAMKTFIERTLPGVDPSWQVTDRGTTHPIRRPAPAGVVLSVAAFPEPAIFGALSNYVRYLASVGFMRRLVAEIYRPAAEAMVAPVFSDKCRDILAATKQAGREIVETGGVAEGTMGRIVQPIADPEVLAAGANAMWKRAIAKGLRLGDPPEEK